MEVERSLDTCTPLGAFVREYQDDTCMVILDGKLRICADDSEVSKLHEDGPGHRADVETLFYK